jgi:hypothetical protein
MLHTAQYPSPPACLGLVILTFKGSEGSATGGPTFYSDIFEADPPAEKSQWVIEDQAFFRLLAYLTSPSPVSNLSLFLSRSVCRWWSIDGWGRRGWAGRRIIRPRESMALYNLFNNLCPTAFCVHSCTSICYGYTVKRARIICLMKMHPGSGPGTSSRKCSMTPIYLAWDLSSNQAK